MSSESRQRRERLIRDVVEVVRKAAKGPDSKSSGEFCKIFYQHAPIEDIERLDSKDLAAAALSIWRFGAERGEGATLIRWLNPRPPEHGWSSLHTVLEIVSDDRPFIIDSVVNELVARGLTIYLTIHPVVHLRRDKQGRCLEFVAEDPGTREGVRAESYLHVEVLQQADSDLMDQVVDGLRRVMDDVRAAVTDWPKMRSRVESILAEMEADPPALEVRELEEGKEFLRWLDDDNFTFLGYREYRLERANGGTQLVANPNTGLGVLRDDARAISQLVGERSKLPNEFTQYIERPELLLIGKSAHKATVHRAVYMDVVGVKQYDRHGVVTGKKVFVGLLTSAAYHRSPLVIPRLRRRVVSVLEASGMDLNSHDGKSLLHTLETFPRDELFRVPQEELLDICLGILELQERHRTALFMWHDPLQRFVSCLVFLPVERHSTDLRRRTQSILEHALSGTCRVFETRIDQDSVLARLHFIIETVVEQLAEPNQLVIEREIADAVRSWDDKLLDALVVANGEAVGIRLAARYAGAFDAAYQEAYDAEQATADIERIEQLLDTDELGMDLYRRAGEDAASVRFKIFHRDRPVTLSETLPVLENLGFRAIEERPYHVTPQDLPSVWIHDFGLVHRGDTPVDPVAMRDAIHAAVAKIWAGSMENDAFNRLIINAQLAWRQVVILRMYAAFLRQVQIPFSQRYMEDTLARHGDVAKRIVQLFENQFQPGLGPDRDARSEQITLDIKQRLDAIDSLDEDRILRSFLGVVRATLRTNYYQFLEPDEPKDYLAIKLDSRQIADAPQPRPMFEIFVYSPEMEGIHLRFGKVARGGLRWSDRREDYRTEILGLVKAQQVKNSVIVPVGSKGGFVVKNVAPNLSRDAFMEKGVACYKMLIRGLLDLTDNFRERVIVAAAHVVRRDDDDPYLVVAADKGTATFSDSANEVAAEYGYWLGDAFASGGSAGYDHKKMGITARGGWESVKRHFREIGKDIQSEEFSVIGVGDMSGDVFGNAMLLSCHIKLIGAFNHQHIFVDPDPDPASSFAERKRLFALPRSSWTDYDTRCLSSGGGVFERRAKSITLSSAARKRFGLSRTRVTPNELIRAILKAEADLLWFGGIGTYVKARQETNADVGDRANDALRIDGHDLRARVIGEGANLGVTQLGRVECALQGSRLNTDSFDNSAGVNCSDHEVNIKTLLGAIEHAGKITHRQRDNLLASMEEEVAQLVIRDNYLQTESLSVTKFIEHRLTDRLSNFMRDLERAGLLDRNIERLPDDDLLADRKDKKIGLTRPELCILMAYAKIVLKQQLLDSQFPDDPFMLQQLERYFPEPLRKKYKAWIAKHRLRREIIAMQTTNSIVNRVGITFFHEVQEKTGKQACDVARGYVISQHVLDTAQLRSDIDALDHRIPPDLQADMHRETGRLTERVTLWFLRHGDQPLNIGDQIERYREGVHEAIRSLDAMLTDADRDYLAEKSNRFIERGAPPDLARRVACLRLLVSACDIVRASHQLNVSVKRAGRVYFRIGAFFFLDWLRRQAAALPVDSHWDNQATTSVVEDLYNHQYALVHAMLRHSSDSDDPEQVISRCCAERTAAFTAAQQTIKEIRESPNVGLAQLAVANHQLRTLAGD